MTSKNIIKFTVSMGESDLFPGTYWLDVDNESPQWAEYVDGCGGLSEGDITDPYEMAKSAGWCLEDVIRRQIEPAFGLPDPNGEHGTPVRFLDERKVEA